MWPRGGGCVELCWVELCWYGHIWSCFVFKISVSSLALLVSQSKIHTPGIRPRLDFHQICPEQVSWGYLEEKGDLMVQIVFIPLIKISPKSNCICNDSKELKENNLFHANQVPISNMPFAVFYLDFLWRFGGIDLFSYLIWRWKVCLSWSNHGDRRLDAR